MSLCHWIRRERQRPLRARELQPGERRGERCSAIGYSSVSAGRHIRRPPPKTDPLHGRGWGLGARRLAGLGASHRVRQTSASCFPRRQLETKASLPTWRITSGDVGSNSRTVSCLDCDCTCAWIAVSVCALANCLQHSALLSQEALAHKGLESTWLSTKRTCDVPPLELSEPEQTYSKR